MKKRLCALALSWALLWTPAARAAGGPAPDTSAASAILMDADSGRVLYEKNAREERLIASITKLMTALAALESGHAPDEMVTIRPEWTGAEGSSIYLKAGEEVTLETLLYGMLLRSGNDAALAVAGHCGGTVEAFVAQMNARARALGMEHSSFANPNGLNAEGHYSTAYDMALLARACLANETLAGIVATRSVTLGTRRFTNHNKLLWRYEGCIGLKTGYTERAGRTLVSAAEREGTTLICVTLNAPDDWTDHSRLLDWGFSNYTAEVVTEEGARWGRLPVEGALIPACPVVAEEGFSATLAEEERVDVRTALSVGRLTAPVEKGQPVGELICSLEGEELARIPLVTGAAVRGDGAEPGGFWARLFGK